LEIVIYMPDATRAAQLNDVPNHGQLAVIVLDTPVLLFRHDDVCTHTGDPLGGGEVDGFVVTCPWHGAQFDIRSGKNLCMPALCPTRAHDAWVENGDVFVRLRE
jgi:nitrite reductase/ring-hydroxylating ferredoxin subunit